MLLITRRAGEAITINGSIEVKVLEVRGGRVKLGFDYPQGNTVYRQELFAKIQAENRAALAGVAKAPESTERLQSVLKKPLLRAAQPLSTKDKNNVEQSNFQGRDDDDDAE